MSTIFEVFQKLMGDIDRDVPMREQDCGLQVPKRFRPYVVYKFSESMAKNLIHIGNHSELPDFIFAYDGFYGKECLVLVELSKGSKTAKKVHSQLQAGFSILEKITSEMSEGERRCMSQVKKFAIYCGSYDKFTHRKFRKMARSKVKGKKVGTHMMEEIKFDGKKVDFIKCNCEDSISVIEIED